MVKLTGPGLAAAAAGQLAGQMIFSQWKGRAYLKKLAKPSQPKTISQVAIRAVMTFLSRNWAAIPAVDKHTWDDLAEASQITPFNAYQRENLTRWTSHRAPSQAYPPAETGLGPSAENYQATSHGRGLIIEWDPLELHQGWAYLLYANKGSAPPHRWNYLRRAVPGQTMDHMKWLWSPLDPGTYYFRLNSSSTSGRYSYWNYQFSATVPP